MPTLSKILCPHCKLPVPYDAALAGTTADCPFCGEAYLIPPGVARTAPPQEPTLALDAPAQTRFLVPPAKEACQPATPPLPEVASDYDEGGATELIDLGDEWEEVKTKPVVDDPALVRLGRRSRKRWRRARAGLAVMEIGYVFVLFGVLCFLLIMLEPRRFGPNVFGSNETSGFAYYVRGCLLGGWAALLIGQVLTLSVPARRARRATTLSFAIALVACLIGLMPLAGPAMGGLATLLLIPLLPTSHLFFVAFHRQIARRVHDTAASRHGVYYLGTYGTYVAVSVCLLLFALSGGGRPIGMELQWLGAIVWSIFNCILAITLLSLMQRIRSIIRDKVLVFPEQRPVSG